MRDERSGSDPLVIQFLNLRKAIGIIGMALPLVLGFGKPLFDAHAGLCSSISAYYYTEMRNVFVGSLCAVGVFLFSYRGFDWRDALAGKVAAASVIGVAMCPTTSDREPTSVTGWFHIVFASVYFLTLAVFALFLFRLPNKPALQTLRKNRRNQVYAVCGCTILLCLALIVIAFRLPQGSPILNLDPVFWLESAAIFAFGICWWVKGEGLLKDETVAATATATATVTAADNRGC